MLSNQWLTEITPPSCNPRNPPKNDRVTGFSNENQGRISVTFVTPKNDIEGERFCVPHDSILEIVHCNNDPFAAMRALNRMTRAGFALALEESALVVSPADRLNEQQRAYLRAHKPALVALLMDADTVYSALAQAGTAGLAWREGTPADWPDARLLAAGEVLYGDGRMMSVYGRRYLKEHAPPFEWVEDAEAGEVAL